MPYSLVHHRSIRYAPTRAGAPMSRRPCLLVRSLEDSLAHSAGRPVLPRYSSRSGPRRGVGAVDHGCDGLGSHHRPHVDVADAHVDRRRRRRGPAIVVRPIADRGGVAGVSGVGVDRGAAVVPALDPPPARPLGPPPRRRRCRRRSPAGRRRRSDRSVAGLALDVVERHADDRPGGRGGAPRLLAERLLLRRGSAAGVGAGPSIAAARVAGTWSTGWGGDGSATADAREARRSLPPPARPPAEARARAPVVERRPRPARGPRARSPGPPRSVPARGRATRAARRPLVRPVLRRNPVTGSAVTQAICVSHGLRYQEPWVTLITERDGG